jgi:hypothetical protein
VSDTAAAEPVLAVSEVLQGVTAEQLTPQQPAGGLTSPIADMDTAPLSPLEGTCTQCQAALVDDQRYCLSCGAPRPHAIALQPGVSAQLIGRQEATNGGVPAGPLQSPLISLSSAAAPTAAQPPIGAQPPVVGASSSHRDRNNAVTLLAGVGVLLLAMAVGVLVGRSSNAPVKTPPAQVISIGGGTQGASTPSTTPAPTPPTPTPTKRGKAREPTGSGSSITKPAPPSAAQQLRSGAGGQSYEQKSKALPDVISTG